VGVRQGFDSLILQQDRGKRTENGSLFSNQIIEIYKIYVKKKDF